MTPVPLSSRELADLGKSTLVVALVFTIAGRPDIGAVPVILPIAILCAGAGFLFHELMHKVLAQRFGHIAEYRANSSSLFSILFAFAGWILLAPGAVYVSGGRITARENGIISLAGPATNLYLALMFHFLSGASNTLLRGVGFFGYDINIWLAIFNTLPAPTFDGSKVFQWNKAVYAVFAAAVLAVALSFGF